MSNELHPNCTSQFLLSQYDKNCPRCQKIWKVICLRRRNLSNGAPWAEALAAARLADLLIEKYGLVKAELTDRLYSSPTNQLPPVGRRSRAASKRKANGTNHILEDDLEGLE